MLLSIAGFAVYRHRGASGQRPISAQFLSQFIDTIGKSLSSLGREPLEIQVGVPGKTCFFVADLDGQQFAITRQHFRKQWDAFLNAWSKHVDGGGTLLKTLWTDTSLGSFVSACLLLPTEANLSPDLAEQIWQVAAYVLAQIASVCNSHIDSLCCSWKSAYTIQSHNPKVKHRRMDR